MSVVRDQIGGACAFEDAPFAVHPLDARRAADILVLALKANLTWADVEADLRAYGAARGWSADFMNEQV